MSEEPTPYENRVTQFGRVLSSMQKTQRAISQATTENPLGGEANVTAQALIGELQFELNGLADILRGERASVTREEVSA